MKRARRGAWDEVSHSYPDPIGLIPYMNIKQDGRQARHFSKFLQSSLGRRCFSAYISLFHHTTIISAQKSVHILPRGL